VDWQTAVARRVVSAFAQPGSIAQLGSAAQVGSHGTSWYTTFGTQRVIVEAT
jgi:hypothetical protein